MKIFDCFMFFDEEMLLDIRLNCLNEYVDKFVIVESEYLHNGERKKPVFNIDNYPKFKDKINYILIKDEPQELHKIDKISNEKEKDGKKILNACARENFQRNQILIGLDDADENDYIMISDLDEIPKLKNIKLNDIKHKFVLFKQKNFYYKFNLCLESVDWYGTKACKKKYLKSPQWLRNIKDRNYPFWRLDIIFSETKQNDIFFIKDGGWHFSYMRSPEEIEKKLKSYLHHIEYEQNPIGVEKIKEKIYEKKAIYDLSADQRKNKFNSSEKLKLQDLNNLPDYIVNNLNKYKPWIELN